MATSEQSIFEQTVNPIIQASIALAGVVIVILGSKLVELTGLLHVGDRFPWVAAASFMLVFALFNSVFSLTSDNILKYWGRSIYSFLGLAFASGMIAHLFSSLSIDEAGSYRWIYIVLTIGYLIFLGMMAFMRRIVDFAQKEEWNQPRIQQKKKNKSSH